jgi:hypothetical protein
VLTNWFTVQLLQWLESIAVSRNAESASQNLPNTSLHATPELNSLLLFGTGLAGAGGYALTLLRAR